MNIFAALSSNSKIDGNCFVEISGQKHRLLHFDSPICFANDSEEAEITIIIQFQKKLIQFVGLWILSFITAPLQILFMNDADIKWHKRILPTKCIYTYKLSVSDEENISFVIKPISLTNKSLMEYSVKLKAQRNPELIKSEIEYSSAYALWKMHKYLSQLFSYCFWAWLVFLFVFFNINKTTVTIIGTVFIALFLLSLVFTVRKYKEIKNDLSG